MRLRFGIGETQTHTLEEVGAIFSLTRERIRQLETKAFKKLRFNIGVGRDKTYASFSDLQDVLD